MAKRKEFRVGMLIFWMLFFWHDIYVNYWKLLTIIIIIQAMNLTKKPNRLQYYTEHTLSLCVSWNFIMFMSPDINKGVAIATFTFRLLTTFCKNKTTFRFLATHSVHLLYFKTTLSNVLTNYSFPWCFPRFWNWLFQHWF